MRGMISNTELVNHIYVVSSIILGLGITELLSGAATWYRNSRKIEGGLALGLWAALVLLTIVQSWWAARHYHEVKYDFWLYLIGLVKDISYFGMAKLVFPDFSSSDVSDYFKVERTPKRSKEKKLRHEGDFNLRAYYARHAVKLCAWALATLSIVSLHEWMHIRRAVLEETMMDERFGPKMLIRGLFAVILLVVAITAHLSLRADDKRQTNERELPKLIYQLHIVLISIFGLLLLFFIARLSP